MDSREIMWVGVRFEPGNASDTKNSALHFGAISKYMAKLEEKGMPHYRERLRGNGSIQHIESEKGELVDVFRPSDGRRIGFGIFVGDVHQGRDLIEETRQWLKDGVGIKDRFVSVFTLMLARSEMPTALVV